MFDLDKAIAAWRRTLVHHPAFVGDDLDELEQHLRDQVAALAAGGLPAAEAFQQAMATMGDYGTAEAEYRKVYWGKLKRRHLLAGELNRRMGMFRNYTKTAVRSLLRQKGYSFLNVAGLTLGMACCLLLFQYVAYEYSFDRFHEKRDRIYRVTFHNTQNGEDQGIQATTGLLLGPTVAQEVPEVVRFARVHPAYGDAVVSYRDAAGDRTFTEPRVFFVDTTFLSIFTYPLLRGDRATALKEPQTLLVSAATARKYFGDADPLGKVVHVTGWVDAPYTVAGVFEDVPAASHLQLDFLLPMEDLLKTPQYGQEGADWGWTNFLTYVETHPGADAAGVEAQVTATYYRHQGAQLAANGTASEAYLQPLLDIHLNADIRGPAAVVGDRKTVYFFLVIGLLTLVIALVNYVNLATARALERAREVGVRKVVGAQRQQLMGQFLLESALMNLAALGIVLSLALLPVVNRLAGVHLTGDLWRDTRFWALFLGVFGAGALLSGLYPAFVLSSFRPVTVLKGTTGSFAARAGLRKVLVVLQFAASIALVAGTTVVYRQLGYMRGLDIGLDLEQVLVVEGPRVQPAGMDAAASMRTFKDELRKLPAVKDLALSVMVPGRGFNWYTRLHRATADPSTATDVRATGIDHDFGRLYGLQLAAGEPFHDGMSATPVDGFPVLVNETLARSLGFATPQDAVQQRLAQRGGNPGFRIQGVLKDFNWSSAHQAADPVMLVYEPAGRSVSLRVEARDLPATLAAIERTFEALFPGNPFSYFFADEAFDEQYRNDRRFAALFGVFAGLTILIACLGLFGLAAFTAGQRTREIGVRKVLGASVPGIVGLLSKDFLQLVGVAFVVAVPAAYVFMDRWLDGFAYRITLGPGVFVLAGVLALLIALVTVSYQAIRAAVAAPVQSLRYE